MAQAVPIVVFAAPGAGGAQLAAALAEASDRPLVAWDEVTDEPLGDGYAVRSACRELLWRRERDWTCPPGELEVDDRDRVLTAPLRARLTADPAPVLYDVALPFILPLLHDACDELLVVVAVRDPREALPHLLAARGLESGAADELLRASHARLAELATVDGVSVVGLTGGMDLSRVAAELTGHASGAEGLRRVPVVAPERAVEGDPAADALLARADAGRARPVQTGVLLAMAGTVETLRLDRYGGPRTAARRALLHGIAAMSGRGGSLLECTRARGLGAWLVTELDVRVAVVDGVAAMQRAVTVPPASQDVVLLSDVASWCGANELRPVLELAMEAVRYGGTIVVGRSAADDDERLLHDLSPLGDDEVTAAARGLGLVALPVRGGEVRGLCFAAQTAVAGTIRNLEDRVAHLEEQLARRTEQRDAVVARHEALQQRRAVRTALGAAEALGGAVRRLRGDSGG